MKFNPWFPRFHQFAFRRNDSWPQSLWLTLNALVQINVTTFWHYLVKPPFFALIALIVAFGNGIQMAVVLNVKFLMFGITGFLSSRDITSEQLVFEAIARQEAKNKEREEAGE